MYKLIGCLYMAYLKRKMSDNSLNAIKERCRNRLQGEVPKKRMQITISVETYEKLKEFSDGGSMSQILEDSFLSLEKIKKELEVIKAYEKSNPRRLRKSQIVESISKYV